MLHKMLFLALVFLIGVIFSSPIEQRQAVPSGCVNITIPVYAYTAKNQLLPPDLDTSNFPLLANPLIAGAFDQAASGTFDISATYCPAAVQVEGREETLQILLHSATYTKSYWLGLYYAQQYSWVSYASGEGYATLSIDRLGNGDSSHPDPIIDVQIPLQVEILHQLVLYARDGSLPLPTQTTFSKIIIAGHSLGSLITNELNFRYPSDADATLLTGYAPFYALNSIGFFVQSGVTPASLSGNSAYADYALGYLEISANADFEYLFYTPGDYDPNLANYDWATRGTVTLGEAASAVASSQTANTYSNPLMVITGLHDSIFCSVSTLDIPDLLSTPTCDTGPEGLVPSTRSLYPDVPDNKYAIYYPEAGHCWHLHYAAMDTFGVAHEWLGQQGF